MAMMRRESMSEIESMRRMMDQVFEQMLGGSMLGRLPGLPQLGGAMTFSPKVEVYTTDQDVVLKAELPGLDPKDVNLEITEDAVHLMGEAHKEQEVQEDNYFRSERMYGQFDRTIPLPERVKADDAKATFRHGVLTIRAPLAEAVKKPQARRLQIEE